MSADLPVVFLVEDEETFIEALEIGLKREGFRVHVARDGAEALAMFEGVKADIVLLDVMLPKISGTDVCREIRKKSQVPIIMVSAKGSEIDTVVGLEVGADDYIVKPYRLRELVARIRAALRRTQTTEPSPSNAKSLNKIGDVEIDRNMSIVRKNGLEVALTKTEYRLLVEFADHPGMVLSRDQLLERVWGYEYLGDSRLVDAHVRRLRVKIETQPDEPTMIVTVRGMGYRLLK